MTCPNDPKPLPCPQLVTTLLNGTDLMALRPVGRPKDMEKREAILDAAMRLFAERGVEGVPVEAIATAAGVSKVTIYAGFKDKSAILEALVLRETARLAELVISTSQTDGPLADRLKRFGAALVSMLSEPCHQALDRCLGVEAQRNPALARRFFEAGPGHLRDILAGMLIEASAAGEIDLPVRARLPKIFWAFGWAFRQSSGVFCVRPRHRMCWQRALIAELICSSAPTLHSAPRAYKPKAVFGRATSANVTSSKVDRNALTAFRPTDGSTQGPTIRHLCPS